MSQWKETDAVAATTKTNARITSVKAAGSNQTGMKQGTKKWDGTYASLAETHDFCCGLQSTWT